MKDMSSNEYKKALKVHGFKPGTLGYIKISDNVEVYPGNADNSSFRERLAYLLRQKALYAVSGG